MILQRIASAIKRQDLSQIIIEIMIVVIGIFLGLQVDDWNENRKDVVEERAFKEQLIIDTSLALNITEETIQYLDLNIASVGEMLKVVKGKELNAENSNEFERALFNIMRFPQDSISIGHLGDVIKGNLPDYIKDKNLVRATTDLERNILLEYGKRQHTQDLLDQSTAILYKYFAQYPAGQEEMGNSYDLDVLRSTPEFIYATQNALAMHSLGRLQAGDIKAQLEEFLNLLEKMQ